MIIIDQLKSEIKLAEKPLRIVSLVPSQTELLYYLGLDESVIGITKFCIHPKEWHHTKTKIGGTKKLNIEKIISLKPDLIIGNKEENEQSQIEELRNYFPVWMSDINTLEDALNMIESIGKITETENISTPLITTIKDSFKIPSDTNTVSNSVVYLIWNEPLIAVGKNTFIDDMLTRCTFTNALSQTRYPEVSVNSLIELQPKYLFLSSEPFPFKEEHRKKYEQLLPHTKVVLVDGEMFSWYGSRLLQSIDYLQNLKSSLG